ncbi:MAG: hypothetical protein K2N55_00545 [Lachnospiraceae bacterium]|nr:hypothetical protein [Lachnospiraceae bacterium]
MREKWMKILPKITENLCDLQLIECPYCGEHEIDYLYVGDEKTRIGYMQVWCNKCLRGIYISRAIAPNNARFVSFGEDISKIVPKYKFSD